MGGGIVFCAAFASASPSKTHRLPPRREPAITLVPLDGGLVIRKRAAAQSGDVTVGQEVNVPVQRLLNNAPAGHLSIGNPAGGRVTVLGVTEETILPGTTKGP